MTPEQHDHHNQKQFPIRENHQALAVKDEGHPMWIRIRTQAAAARAGTWVVEGRGELVAITRIDISLSKAGDWNLSI